MYIGRYHSSLDVNFSVLALGKWFGKRLCIKILCHSLKMVLGENYTVQVNTCAK